MRKEFVRPDRAQFPGDDGYRFAHILVRDAAYDAMSKELRAELHVRFVEWLERIAAERLTELEEIVAYHLERAALYRRELGLAEGEAANRAAELLARSGERAYDRGDVPAARSLLGRATALLAIGDSMRVRLLPMLGAALFAQGEFESAIETLSTALNEAELAGAREVAVGARAMLSLVGLQTDPDQDFAAIESELDAALPELESFNDLRAVVSVRRLDVLPLEHAPAQCRARRLRRTSACSCPCGRRCPQRSGSDVLHVRGLLARSDAGSRRTFGD